jgi:predicted ester cyclase
MWRNFGNASRLVPAISAVAVFALLAFLARAGETKVDVSKIHGRIQYVSSFPDYKVQAVTSFPDLRVQIVTSFPDKPGRWQIVDSFPDYKIQMVQSFPDFTVEFVESFPGPAK